MNHNNHQQSQKVNTVCLNNNNYGRPILPKKPDMETILMNNKKEFMLNNNNNLVHYQDPSLLATRPVSQTILTRPSSNNGLNERRFSYIQVGEYMSAMDLQDMHTIQRRKCIREDSIDGSMTSSNYAYPQATDGKATLSRKALKIAQKAQKLSISSIGSELSNSASALYSLFTANEAANVSNNNCNGNIMSVSQHNNINIQTSLNNNYNNILDKTDAVSLHTQRGIDFLDRFSQFVKERAAIEEEYAMKLRNLVKKKRKEEKDEHRKEERRKDEDGKKSNEDDDCRLYSYTSAFFSILSELDSLAAQHEIVGEKMKRDIVPMIAEKSQLLRAGRKKQLQGLQALNGSLQEHVENMRKLQKNYA